MNAETVPSGYWKDAQGNLVPEAKVKEEHKLEDELVREQIKAAKDLNAALAKFKESSLNDAAAFRALIADRYDAKRGGRKGNMTLRTFDGEYELQVAVSETLSFGPELQAAKDLIDECVVRWSEGANDNLKVMVNQAFQVSKEGRIDTGRVLGLRKLDIDDPQWHRAMTAIADAIRVTSSKTYIRFYEIDPETGVRSAISLDLAAV